MRERDRDRRPGRGRRPGGSAAAYHLARHGIDVTVVDKATFPREKVCGDGLTPRSVGAIDRMGDRPRAGSRVRAGDRASASTPKDVTIDLPWPELSVLAGLRPRDAAARTSTTSSREQAEEGRRARDGGDRGRRPAHAGRLGRGGRDRRPPTTRTPSRREIHARFTIAADGAASRFAKPAGVRRDDSRPLGIAARRYYRAPNLAGPGSSRGSTCGRATCSCPATDGSSRWPTAASTSAPGS